MKKFLVLGALSALVICVAFFFSNLTDSSNNDGDSSETVVFGSEGSSGSSGSCSLDTSGESGSSSSSDNGSVGADGTQCPSGIVTEGNVDIEVDKQGKSNSDSFDSSSSSSSGTSSSE